MMEILIPVLATKIYTYPKCLNKDSLYAQFYYGGYQIMETFHIMVPNI